MTNTIQVQIAELRATGSELNDVADRLAAILATASSSSAAYWGTWGSDKFGTSFSGGEHGYIASDSNVKEVLKAKIELLRQYAKGLVEGADALQAMENVNTAQYR